MCGAGTSFCGYRGHNRGRDSPALAVLVGLKEKKTLSIKSLLLQVPGGVINTPRISQSHCGLAWGSHEDPRGGVLP